MVLKSILQFLVHVELSQVEMLSCVQHVLVKKVKVARARLPVLGSQPAGDVSRKPGGRLPLFPPGLQLPARPLIVLLPISLLCKQRHDGCEQFA